MGWIDLSYGTRHEIVGKVVKTGSHVKKFKAGDTAGVGVIVDSCRVCKPCNDLLEQYCAEGATGTYNGYERDKKSIARVDIVHRSSLTKDMFIMFLIN